MPDQAISFLELKHIVGLLDLRNCDSPAAVSASMAMSTAIRYGKLSEVRHILHSWLWTVDQCYLTTKGQH